jgi:methyl coenzyme M reductase alpha subunit
MNQGGERAVNAEHPKLPVYDTSEKLDFFEDDSMVDLRHEIVASMQRNDGSTRELVGAYLQAAEDAIESQPLQDQVKARIGRDVAVALMQRDAGRSGEEYLPHRIRNYVEDLEQALDGLDGEIVRRQDLEEDTADLEDIYRTLCKAHDDELADYERRNDPGE